MFYKDGLRFECKLCSKCCRFDPGVVFFSNAELKKMADFLKISQEEFLKKYCRKIFFNGQYKISLIEKNNFDCIFWDEKCLIYPARPKQCSTYPFWPEILKNQDSWDSEAKECPGINSGKLKSFKEISELLEFYNSN